MAAAVSSRHLWFLVSFFSISALAQSSSTKNPGVKVTPSPSLQLTPSTSANTTKVSTSVYVTSAKSSDTGSSISSSSPAPNSSLTTTSVVSTPVTTPGTPNGSVSLNGGGVVVSTSERSVHGSSFPLSAASSTSGGGGGGGHTDSSVVSSSSIDHSTSLGELIEWSSWSKEKPCEEQCKDGSKIMVEVRNCTIKIPRCSFLMECKNYGLTRRLRQCSVECKGSGTSHTTSTEFVTAFLTGIAVVLVATGF